MKKVKDWPKDDKPADFVDLCEQVTKAIKFAYKLERQNRGKGIVVDGLDSPSTGVDFKGSRSLTARQLRRSEIEGRDALDEIVGFAIRLGIEQGRRITMTGNEVGVLKDKIRMIKVIAEV